MQHGAGRVVVLADSDLVGDDSIDELDHARFWTNIATWASAGHAAAPSAMKMPQRKSRNCTATKSAQSGTGAKRGPARAGP